ncbi:hypothetical protein JL722_14650 [Aureococcus anophagefferens]|nr:hypothetical protein JL722_14650 [Aureococcus anophagefferens]
MPSIPRSFGLLVLSRVVIPRPPDWQDKPPPPACAPRVCSAEARGGWECGVVMAVDNTYWNTVNAFGRYARDYIPMYEADLDRMGIRHLPVGSGCPLFKRPFGSDDEPAFLTRLKCVSCADAEIDYIYTVDMDSVEANWGYCDGTSDEICVPCAPSEAEPAPSCDAVADPCEELFGATFVGDAVCWDNWSASAQRDWCGRVADGKRCVWTSEATAAPTPGAPSRRRRPRRRARRRAPTSTLATGATTAASEPTTTAAAADGDDGDALTASASLYVLGACILLVGVAIGVGLSRRLKSRRRHIDAHCVELADVATRVDPPMAEIVSVNPFGEKEELIMQAHC